MPLNASAEIRGNPFIVIKIKFGCIFIKTSGHCIKYIGGELMTEYTDARGNTYKIEEKCVLSEEERRKAEEETAEELYRIFTNK